MSNVLIGIIGVILFIGLALAGALFLGPRFQESANNSKASASVQAVAQVSSAANMANVDTGIPVKSGTAATGTLTTSNFLKTLPTNPVKGTAGIQPVTVDSGGNVTPANDAYYVVMPIGNDTQAICDAVSRQSGTGATAPTVATFTSATVTNVSGCVKSTAAVGGSTAGDFVVYARI